MRATAPAGSLCTARHALCKSWSVGFDKILFCRPLCRHGRQVCAIHANDTVSHACDRPWPDREISGLKSVFRGQTPRMCVTSCLRHSILLDRSFLSTVALPAGSRQPCGSLPVPGIDESVSAGLWPEAVSLFIVIRGLAPFSAYPCSSLPLVTSSPVSEPLHPRISQTSCSPSLVLRRVRCP